MQEEHKKAIQKNFTSLVERTDLDAMVTALFEKGVFSEPMVEPYRNNSETQRERKRKLYRDITRRGPHAFDNLMDVLREMGYWDLVRELDPNSPLQLRPHRSSNSNPGPKPKATVADEDFVSISTEKKKTKTNLEMQKNSLVLPPETSQADINDDSTDLNTDIPHFQVKKSIKFMEHDDSKDIKLYRTRGRQRGVLLVFSYTEFKLNIESFREGIEVDCKNLKYLFSEFGFKMLCYQNLNLEETRNTLETMKNVLVGAECVFIVFSSHGYERKGSQDTDIRCSDGNLISFTDILEYFNNRSLPDLADIPKVFIFQVCRGSASDYVYSNADELRMPEDVSWDGTPKNAFSEPLERRAPPPDPVLVEKPIYTNILIAHSTVPGYVSHRDNKKGSWYIQTICEVFAEHAHDCHVDRLFTLVDQRMRDRYRIQTSSVDRWGFNKKLYLHPGLYE